MTPTQHDVRFCVQFLHETGLLLGNFGFKSDQVQIERTAHNTIVFYHYTREENLDQVLMEGLRARLPIVSSRPPVALYGRFYVEGLIDPLPRWLTDSPYFGDLGIEMFQKVVGDVLLHIEVPDDLPDLYVADNAHWLDCIHLERRGCTALNLGYRCENGRECSIAHENSYVPIQKYQGGHVAPNIRATRIGQGIAISPESITVSTTQPLQLGG